MRASLILAAAIALAAAGSVEAHHKPGHHMPPGQMKKTSDTPAQGRVPSDVMFRAPDEMEHVCLVTTQVAGDPYSNVLSAEWLPRNVAMAEAQNGDGFVIYHSSMDTEEGCLGI
jgi:hypothetical protein